MNLVLDFMARSIKCQEKSNLVLKTRCLCFVKMLAGEQKLILFFIIKAARLHQIQSWSQREKKQSSISPLSFPPLLYSTWIVQLTLCWKVFFTSTVHEVTDIQAVELKQQPFIFSETLWMKSNSKTPQYRVEWFMNELSSHSLTLDALFGQKENIQVYVFIYYLITRCAEDVPELINHLFMESRGFEDAESRLRCCKLHWIHF